MNKDEIIIGVIGLGYVGLPLAVEFGKSIETIGFDINASGNTGILLRRLAGMNSCPAIVG